MKTQKGSNTENAYENYINARKLSTRFRIVGKYVMAVFLAASLGYGAAEFKKAFESNDKISEINGTLYEIQQKLKDEDNPDLIKLYNNEYEINSQMLEYEELTKTLYNVNGFAVIGVSAAALFLFRFLKDLFEKRMNATEKEFLDTFLDEITFIKSDKDYRCLDTIIYYFLEDVARKQQTTQKDLLIKINDDDPFPEFSLEYKHILRFMNEYLQKTDFSKENPDVYNAIPKDYVAFASYLSKTRKMNVSNFFYLDKETQLEIAETFMKMQKDAKEEQNRELKGAVKEA